MCAFSKLPFTARARIVQRTLLVIHASKGHCICQLRTLRLPSTPKQSLALGQAALNEEVEAGQLCEAQATSLHVLQQLEELALRGQGEDSNDGKNAAAKGQKVLEFCAKPGKVLLLKRRE